MSARYLIKLLCLEPETWPVDKTGDDDKMKWLWTSSIFFRVMAICKYRPIGIVGKISQKVNLELCHLIRFNKQINNSLIFVTMAVNTF